MADAYRCDRCGDMRMGEPPNTLTAENSKDGVPTVGGEHVTRGSYDLCGDCGRAFEEWMDG